MPYTISKSIIGCFINLDLNNPDNQNQNYDFRILDNHTSDKFYMLGYLNLAKILCRNLGINLIKNDIIEENQNLEHRITINWFNYDVDNDSFTKNNDNNNDTNRYIEIYCTTIESYVLISNFDGQIDNFKLSLNTLTENGRTKGRDLFRFETNQNKINSNDLINSHFYLIFTTTQQQILNVIIDNNFNDKKISYQTHYNNNLNIQDNSFYLAFTSNSDISDINYLINISYDDFISLAYNCLPTPKFTYDEKNINRNDGDYIMLGDHEFGIAIDPSDNSKDKDDAIHFSETANEIIMTVYIADVLPYMNIDTYPFKYASYKGETEYISPTKKFPLIDSEISEDLISLMNGNNYANRIRITYSKKGNGEINPVPLRVELDRVRNLKVYYTTYSHVHQNLINEDNGENLLSEDGFISQNGFIRINRIIHNCFNLKPDLEIDLENIFRFGQLNNLDDTGFLRDQLKLFHTVYQLLSRSLESNNRIVTKNIGQEINFNFNEQWIHSLVEITAIETNIYCAMMQLNNFNNRTLYINEIDDYIRNYFIDSLTGNNNVMGFFRGERSDNDLILNSDYLLMFFDKNQNTSFLNFKNNFFSGNVIENLGVNYYYHQSLFSYIYYYELYNNKVLNKNVNQFSALNTTEFKFHYDINSVFYTHFTSPLRRFIDICVHANLFNDLNNHNLYNRYRNYFVNCYQNYTFNKNFKFFSFKFDLIKKLNEFQNPLNFSAVYFQDPNNVRFNGFFIPILEQMIYLKNNDTTQYLANQYYTLDITADDYKFDYLNPTLCNDNAFINTIINNYGLINENYNMNNNYHQDYLNKYLLPNNNIVAPTIYSLDQLNNIERKMHLTHNLIGNIVFDNQNNFYTFLNNFQVQISNQNGVFYLSKNNFLARIRNGHIFIDNNNNLVFTENTSYFQDINGYVYPDYVYGRIQVNIPIQYYIQFIDMNYGKKYMINYE